MCASLRSTARPGVSRIDARYIIAGHRMTA